MAQSRVIEGDIPKEAVLYIFRPEVRIVCKECVFVNEKEKKCKLFGPNQDISPDSGTCGFYIHGHGKPDMPWIGLVTKDESGYMENPTGFQCKRCHEFNCAQQSCKKVDKNSKGDTPGVIHANACCNLWEADKVRSKLPDDKLEEYLSRLK
jgi:hypothetical protein